MLSNIFETGLQLFQLAIILAAVALLGLAIFFTIRVIVKGDARTLKYGIASTLCLFTAGTAFMLNFGWVRFILLMIPIAPIYGITLFILMPHLARHTDKSMGLKLSWWIALASFAAANLFLPDGGDVGEMYFFFSLIKNDILSDIASVVSFLLFACHFFALICTIIIARREKRKSRDIKNMTTTTFGYAPERKQNPYIGFMTFQRFSGDPLYSDCIVSPSNNMCETESYECYPVPDDVEQRGDEQGFYPDGSLAYIRFLWKELEPQRGMYNVAFVEEILERARERNQRVILRLMAHSTRARDDVPEWLKSVCQCPERPDGKRVKDSPTDPIFIELFLEAVKRLGREFDGHPYLYAVDISLPGAWGEGYKLELYPDDILERIVDVYTEAFKKTKLFGQVGRPELLEYANNRGVCGWRGDGFGDPYHVTSLYPPRIERVKDMWKIVPVSFESYWWLGEWQRKGWDIDMLIKKSLEWHISSFNGKSMPIPFEWEDKISEWVSKMGYHFVIDSVTVPKIARSGSEAEMSIDVSNIGVAPIYTKIPLVVRLCGNGEYIFETPVDITKWLPGKWQEKIYLRLPSDMPKGRYEASIGICGENLPSVVFCTDAPADGDFSVVGSIEIA